MSRQVWLGALAAAAGFSGTAAGVRQVLEAGGISFSCRSEGLVRHAVARFESEPAARNVVVLVGSSYTARGLNGELLERKLHDLGLPVSVIQLSRAGSNHLERYWSYRRFLRLIGTRGRQTLLKRRVLVMLEVSSFYGVWPFGKQFEANAGTAEVYAYLDPPGVVSALLALRGHPGSGRTRWMLAGKILRHGTVNALNIGARSLRRAHVQPVAGFRPLRFAKTGYSFVGLDLVREVLNQSSDIPSRHAGWYGAWFADAIEGPLLATSAAFRPDLAYFVMPTCRSHEMQCAIATGQAVTDHPVLAPTEGKLIEALDHEMHWYDDGHLQQTGAAIVTGWLAYRLVEQGILTK